MNKKILSLILLIAVVSAISVLPFVTFACSTNPNDADYCSGGDAGGGGGSTGISLGSIAQGAANAAWTIATAIVVILWILTGVLFLMAQGAPEKLNKAKLALFTSVAGTILIILAGGALTMLKDVITGK